MQILGTTGANVVLAILASSAMMIAMIFLLGAVGLNKTESGALGQLLLLRGGIAHTMAR